MAEEHETNGLCTRHDKFKEYIIDPFMADVYNEEIWIWACEDCAQERADDI